MFQSFYRELSYNLRLGFPVMLSLFGHTFVGMVDNIMVGKLGADELAAASLANSFVFIAIAIAVGFSIAITPLIAESDGKNDLAEAKSVFQNGLFMCTLVGVLLFLLLFAAEPLFSLMHQPKHVVELAIPFFRVVAFSLIPLSIFQGYKQFADGFSSTKYAMYATIFANIINIAVNYCLIYGIWIFPKMGMLGAAVGTLTARTLMVIFMHLFIRKNKKLGAILKGINFSSIRVNELKKILQLGFPTAMQMFFEIAIFNAAVWISGVLGAPAQAANQIALNLGSMTFTVATGLSVTAMIRVGNQKGKKDFKALRQIAGSIFVLVFLIEFVFGTLFITCNHLLPRIFVNLTDSNKLAESLLVIHIAAKIFIVSGLFQIFDGIQVVALGALRGIQDVKIPMWITLISYWVIAFPLTYYLGLYTDLKAVGIWIGLLCGLASSAILNTARFHQLSKRMLLANK